MPFRLGYGCYYQRTPAAGVMISMLGQGLGTKDDFSYVRRMESKGKGGVEGGRATFSSIHLPRP